MKTIKLLTFLILLSTTAFSQSKKELDVKILQLEEKTKEVDTKIPLPEEKTKNLENEISNIKTNLTNTTTTLGLVSKSNLDLEKLVNEQSLLIQKLIKQNDSLLIVFQIKKDTEFVSVPKNEEDSIIFLIQSYYACKKWEDRLNYVLDPEKVNQYMKEHYTEKYRPYSVKKDEITFQSSGLKPNEVFKVFVYDDLFYCKKSNNDFKIDWMATNGINPVSLKTFKANLSTESTAFRVNASIDTYFNYNYMDAQNTHWNVRFSDNDGNSTSGYISKSSAEGKKLYEILKDGKRHAVIMEIKIDATEDKSGGIAIINKLIKEGWSKE